MLSEWIQAFFHFCAKIFPAQHPAGKKKPAQGGRGVMMDQCDPSQANCYEPPPGLQEGGEWLTQIRDEITRGINAAGCVQVRQVPPLLVRLLTRRWLHFPGSWPTE